MKRRLRFAVAWATSSVGVAGRSFSLICFVLVAAFAAALIPPAWGQITNVSADQATPIPGAGHDYIHLLSETVNPADGSLSVRIGVPQPPGRQLTVPFAFAYDSNGWQHLIDGGNGLAVWISNTSYLAQNGWSYAMPLLEDNIASLQGVAQHSTCSYNNAYLFHDPAGGRHALHLGINQQPGYQNCEQYKTVSSGGDDLFAAAAGSTPAYNPPVTVADADGTAFQFSNPQAHHTYQSTASTSTGRCPALSRTAMATD
jgi:hypothetical protein